MLHESPSPCVTRPFLPKRRMKASETRKGGEMRGTRLMSEMKRLPGTVVRVTA